MIEFDARWRIFALRQPKRIKGSQIDNQSIQLRMKHVNIILILFLLSFSWSCTKDRNPDFIEEQWDFSGMWNAYGYSDKGGWVPIEVIEIIKTSNNHYIAYKRIGDNSVRSGSKTWEGSFTSNPVFIKMTVLGNSGIQELDTELVVKSANVLAIEKFFNITYVRRVE